MTTYDIHFQTISHEDFRVPYIRDKSSVVYTCDGKEGSIAFDGYYYVENHGPPYPEDSDTSLKPWEKPQRYTEWLPKTAIMSMTLSEAKPYKVEGSESEGWWREYYNELDKQLYKIEIYKKEVYESTDKISQIEDDDGEPMNVCFFPTNKMKIWFKVLEDFNTMIMPTYIPRSRIPEKNTLYASKEAYKRILEWGDNNSNTWWHPVSRSDYTYLHTIKVGDIIECRIDGLSKGVQVLNICEVHMYPALKSLNGEFKLFNMRVDRVIRVKSMLDHESL